MPQTIQAIISLDSDFKNDDKLQSFYSRMPQYLHQTFHKTDEDLKSQSFDTNLSGSTCSVLIFDRNTLFSANAGDSRAVLYSARSIKALTEDHKPCLPVERRRVI